VRLRPEATPVRELAPGHPRFQRIRRVAGNACLFALLAHSFAATLAAHLDPGTPIRQFIHEGWQTAQGLPQDSVLSIAQTRDGYLWLGTEEGLVRFDGVRFTVFDKHTSGLVNNMVQALLVDHDQNLWVGTGGGGLSRLRDGRFTSFTTENGLANNSVRALYEDRQGAIWIGTDGGGLMRYQDGRFHLFTTADGLADNVIFSISGERNGTIWIATRGGLNRFSNGKFERLRNAGHSACEVARAVHIDRSGALWLGTTDGLCRIAPDGIRRFTTKNGLSSNTVYSLFEDTAGSLWIGTANGVTRFANGRFSSFTEKDGLLGKDVWALFEDREGSLWMGTAGGGLNRLKKSLFTTLSKTDGLLSDTILPVYEDSQRTLWIGSDQGLGAWKNGRFTRYTTEQGLPDNLVFSLSQDRTGNMWIGTRNGLALLRNGRITAQRGLPKTYTLCTYVDHENRVWAGSRAGLSVFDGHTSQTFTTRDGLSNNNVLSILEDRDDALWIGTGGGGINRLKNGRFTSFTTRDGLASDVIWAISGDSDGTLWLGTNGGGMSRLRNGKITTYTTAHGLLDDSVLAVVDDQRGNLWMSSNKGIFKVSKKQLNDFAAGLTNRITPTVYGTADGMKASECNGGFQPSAWRLSDGRLCFPTAKGLAVIDPGHLAPTAIRPLLERVLVDTKEVRIDRPVVVPQGKGQLEFSFTAPTFLDPEKLQFRYILEGFDKDWTEAGTRRTAYYTNIPPGKYRFKVRAGIDGEWSEAAPEFSLTLRPHYYETPVFYIAVAFAFLSLGAGVYRMRVNQLKLREQKLVLLVGERTAALQESEQQLRASHDQLEIRVRERTHELVQANRALEEEIAVRRRTEEQLILAKEAAEAASRAKSEFLANMSHEIRTPINGIIGMTEITLSTDLHTDQREYLEIVRSSADSLLHIVNDILDFSKIEARKLQLDCVPLELRELVRDILRSLSLRARQKNLALTSHISPAVPNALRGDPLRIRQVLLNLLDNALKFTQDGSVSLCVSLESIVAGSALLRFAVTDTGIGIPAAKQKTIFEAFSQADTSSTRKYGGTGLGLTISSQLVGMMGGRLSVESKPGEGSTFQFAARFDFLPRVPDASLEPLVEHPASVC